MSAQKSCGCGCGTLSCGCCAGVEPVTPLPTANRPGLSALTYRVGDYGSFLETMSARLGLHELPGGEDYDGSLRPPTRPLAGLTTRDPSDPSMALLDAWSTVGDVLTFYQERIANEGYLRTAIETRSVYELARLVGYRPRPGVAASVYLAYSIDTNTTGEVVIPKGARSQSVPGPGEFPQSFETSEPLAARARWNEIKLRTEQPQRLADLAEDKPVYFKGVNTGLQRGDPLLIEGSKIQREVVRVIDVQPDNAKQRTSVFIQRWDISNPDSFVRRKPSLAPLNEVLARAPKNPIASTIVKATGAATARAGGAAPGQGLSRAAVDEADAAIVAELEKPRGAVPVSAAVRSWIVDVRAALVQAMRQGDDETPPHDVANLSVGEVLSRLSRPGSRPLASAAELSRKLTTSFTPTSDAGFRLAGAVRPDIRDSLGPSVAGQTDPNAERLMEMRAFRVRAGLFGRNAPKQQEVVGRDPARTQVIGEWPIVELETTNLENVQGKKVVFKVKSTHESVNSLYLDASYDGIAPDDWVFIDCSAVVIDKADPEPRPLVTPVEPAMLTTVREVHAKISRSEYGISGDTVRIDLPDKWIKMPAIGEQLEIPQAENNEQNQKPGEAQLDVDRDFQVIRRTAVYTRTENLELALEPIEADFCISLDPQDADAQPVELDGLYPDLEPGRFVIVTGERADLGENTVVRAAEAVMIRAVRHDVRVADKPVPRGYEISRAGGEKDPGVLVDDRPHTFIWFDKPLSYCYRRNTVSIRANVVKATHGETRNESLGNGDGSKPLQNFQLKQFPLTYLAAPTASGAASTLEVYVNDVRWNERGSFVMSSPRDRIYVTKGDELGKTTVTFGNGIEGARLPTGSDNVKAVYRNGIGKPGNVRAGQISQLSTRPLGVKDVVNPLRASGGADPEARDAARRNTPNAILALDRLVSTRDYADFSRAFAGIGKAAAVELPDGARTVVHVTIAGSDDIPIDTSSDLYRALWGALRNLGDPFQPVMLTTRELLVLVISAKVRIDADRRWEVVVAALRAALLDAFGFDRRDLAQGVASSEVLAVMQAVPGVAYVDLDNFGAVPTQAPAVPPDVGFRPLTPEEIATKVQEIVAISPPPTWVVVAAARPADDGAGILPAQLAILLPDAPDTLVLTRIE